MKVTVGSSDPTTYSFSELSYYSFDYKDIDVSVTLNQDPQNTGTYYSTFSNAESCKITSSASGLVPYYATTINEGTSTTVTLQPIEAESGTYYLAANTGYLFKGTSSSYTITTYGYDVDAPTGNKLVANLAPLTITSDNQNSIYVLGTNSSNVVGFYHWAISNVLEKGKAYLAYTSTGGSEDGVKMSFGDADDGETTGITSVNAAVKGNGYIYDLAGRRVSTPTKGGVYIKDGKKVIF